MNKIQTLLQESDVILADGAMGTMLLKAGLEEGTLPEAWNVDEPEKVAAIHRAYLNAGSRILLTNTFGGTRFRFARHGAKDRVYELNRAAATLLRDVVDGSGTNAVVAGDIGPSGKVLIPVGDLNYDDAADGFEEQAQGLVEGGVDVIWIETMADLEEVRAAVEGVRRVSDSVPIITTMSFDTHGHTVMGVSPDVAATTLGTLGAIAVGGNCGTGPEELLQAIEKMRSVAPDTLLVSKANAGVPRLVSGKTTYDADPPTMAQYALNARDAGAHIIGACCGSTPEHIQAMAEALAGVSEADE
jgi:5-methyltetrahydrofolate--homocysteine methyltransferase